MSDELNILDRNVEQMPLMDLKKLIEEEDTKTESRLRDENGRFLSAEPVVEADSVEDTEVTVYRKEIDLGDGSGVQVFTAPTIEDLVDKLAEAQANATKKIRELNTRIKAIQPPVSTKKELTADEEFVLSQELINHPSKVLEQKIAEEIERRETAKQQRLEQENAASNDFMTRNPDYMPSQANGTRLINYLKTYKLDPTVDNLERAYTELAESGLLQVRSGVVGADEGVTANADTTAEAARIEHSVERQKVTEPVQRKRVASGFSGRGGIVTPPAKSATPTEDELYSMPLEKLRELANKQALTSTQ